MTPLPDFTLSCAPAFPVHPTPPSPDGGARATASAASHEVAGWFGVPMPDVCDGARAIDTDITPTSGSAEPTGAQTVAVRLAPHRLIFITGPSGAGKTLLLRDLIRRLRTSSAAHVRVAGPDGETGASTGQTDQALGAGRDVATLIDALAPLPVSDRLSLLAVSGLNDARVLLRSPQTLSAGQAHRFSIATAIAGLVAPAEADRVPDTSSPPRLGVLCIDEFGSNLDRHTAAALAASVRRLTRLHPVSAVLVTAHDDLLEALQPDCIVEQHLGQTTTIHELQPAAG